MSDQVDKLKDFIASRALAILQSPHTSVPGALIAISAVLEIFFPELEPKLHKLREFLMAYIGITASQIKAVPKNDLQPPANGTKSDTATVSKQNS